MTTPLFPAKLPPPSVEGYGLEPETAFIRTDMEGGTARQRRRYTAAPTRVPVQWNFTFAEFALFEYWYENTIQSGAAWFELGLANGSLFNVQEARFTQAWRARADKSALYWEVSATLEVRQRPLLSAEHYEAMAAYGNEIHEAHPALHQLVHVTLPNPYWGP